MKKITDEQLAKISSMAELKKAQCRVNRQTRALESSMKLHCLVAKDTYSYSNLIGTVIKTADSVQSYVRYARNGYAAVKKCIYRPR